MTDICIYSDEMYPVFYAVQEKEGFWSYGRKCKWPDDLSLEDYQEAVDLFHIWQDRLETIYHSGTKVE